MIPKIDLEAHFYDDPSFAALAANEGKGWPYYTASDTTLHWHEGVALNMSKLMPKFVDYLEMRLPEMDELGIAKQVLSLGPGLDALAPGDADEACRKSNDGLAEIVAEAPDRFLGAATVPMNDPDAAVAELEHCVGDLGFVMLQAHSNYGEGVYPDDRRFWPVWQKVADLGIFAYLHPTITCQPMFLDYGYPMANSALGFTVDAVGAIVRMILSGIFDEIPNLKIVLGHYGETLPFLMDRLDNRLRLLPNQPKMKNQLKPSEYFGRNIQVTTSGNPSIPAFECSRAALGMDNIMLGTDHPYESMTESLEFLETCPMSREDREKLYYKNAEKLLGIKL